MSGAGAGRLPGRKLDLLPRAPAVRRGLWPAIGGALLLLLFAASADAWRLTSATAAAERQAAALEAQLAQRESELQLVRHLKALREQLAALANIAEEASRGGLQPAGLLSDLDGALEPGGVWQSLRMDEQGRSEAIARVADAALAARLVRRLESSSRLADLRVAGLEPAEPDTLKLTLTFRAIRAGEAGKGGAHGSN